MGGRLISKNYVYPDGSGTLCLHGGRLRLTKEQVRILAVQGVLFNTVDGESTLPVGKTEAETTAAMKELAVPSKTRASRNSRLGKVTRVTINRITLPDGTIIVQENMMEWARKEFDGKEIRSAYYALMRYGHYKEYTVEKLGTKNITISRHNGHE